MLETTVKVAKLVAADGFTVAELHSNRTPAQRTKAMDGFRRGQYQVMVATNIAARGLDVDHITHVISTDVPDVPENARRLAYEELLIAEGSDWNWWYGPEHGSDNRPEFDQLYRDHLTNVYRALGLNPPGALAHPILRSLQAGEIHQPPQNPICVHLDGEVTSYFEWLGAGRYRPDPRSGAMHGAAPPAREIFYGSDGESLFIRLDGTSADATIQVETETGIAVIESAVGRIVEMRAPFSPRFRVHVSHNGFPPVTFPPHGWLEI